MGAFFKGALKWLGIGGLVGVGSSAVTGGGSVASIVTTFFNTGILIALGILFVWLMFKFIKR